MSKSTWSIGPTMAIRNDTSIQCVEVVAPLSLGELGTARERSDLSSSTSSISRLFFRLLKACISEVVILPNIRVSKPAFSNQSIFA
jgi:hypothetical protein